MKSNSILLKYSVKLLFQLQTYILNLYSINKVKFYNLFRFSFPDFAQAH